MRHLGDGCGARRLFAAMRAICCSAFHTTTRPTTNKLFGTRRNPTRSRKAMGSTTICGGGQIDVVKTRTASGTPPKPRHTIVLSVIAKVRVRSSALRPGSATAAPTGDPFDARFDQIIEARRREADEFYRADHLRRRRRGRPNVMRQALAVACCVEQAKRWRKACRRWLDRHGVLERDSDPILGSGSQESPQHASGSMLDRPDRDHADAGQVGIPVVSPPWDLGLPHRSALSRASTSILPKQQLNLLLRRTTPYAASRRTAVPPTSGTSGDVNPPVVHRLGHAVFLYLRIGAGTRHMRRRSRSWSAPCQGSALNFGWWVNRKGIRAGQATSLRGGFLGLDNIGVFDRSAPLPTGGLSGAGRTARHRMALYCPEHAGDRSWTWPGARPAMCMKRSPSASSSATAWIAHCHGPLSAAADGP